MPTFQKKIVGSQSVQHVEVRVASRIEADHIEASLDRLLAELVRQERNQGRLHHESPEKQK